MSERQRDDELTPALREAVGRLPRSVAPPEDLWPGIRERIRRGKKEGRSGNGGRWWIPLGAAAAAVLVIALAWWRMGGEGNGRWEVRRMAGTPRVDDAPIGPMGGIRVGQWLETDDSSRAVIAVGAIGRVEVKPGSRVRLVRALPTEHRLALARGAIYAQVDAPPRLFFVDTPAGTAVDLGCAYMLDVDSLGNGLLRVTAGYVELDWSGRRSIVPLGAAAETRPGVGPGTPYTQDAPEQLRHALAAFDFGSADERATAARAVVAAARAEDAVSLWHLLQRVDQALRPPVVDRLLALVPPPADVTREHLLRLEPSALESYWQRIKRIAWRREILRGVREIDPSTGLAR